MGHYDGYYDAENERRRKDRLRSVMEMATNGDFKTMIDAARVSKTEYVLVTSSIFRDIVELLARHTKVE